MSTGTAKKGSVQSIKREIGLPEHIINLLKMTGVELPDNVKEITTETVSSDEARTITIPSSMTKLEAARELEKQYESEEQLIDQLVDFPEWQWKDVLIAAKKVTEETFGWMNAKASMFSNPTEIDITVNLVNGVPTTERAYIGDFRITTWDDAKAKIDINRAGVVILSINAKRKFASEINQYFELIRQYLRENSIYKGKSIVVTESPRGGADFELIENKPSDKIVLNQDEKDVVETFVIDSLGEPGKRTYLFTGDYGNAKTETAMLVGKKAVEKGISFFYLKDARLFDQVLTKLKQYSPAVLFVEDIDEIAGTEDRDAAMNKILNTLDGVQTKGNNLTTIFTTNHIGRINTALRRPGRIDLIVKFENPSKESVRKIYDIYFSRLNGYADLDMDSIVDRTPDAQGAVIAEIAKRVVKMHDRKGSITTEQARSCVVSMDYHIQIMKEDPTTVTKEKVLYDSLQEMVGDQVAKHF